MISSFTPYDRYQKPLFVVENGLGALDVPAADGTVEKELFYGKGMDLGQQHYLMPEAIKELKLQEISKEYISDCSENLSAVHFRILLISYFWE